jgi:hypothetical protein
MMTAAVPDLFKAGSTLLSEEGFRDPMDEDLEAAALGLGLPPDAEEHLRLAGLNYERDSVALNHLDAAAQLAPGHAAVLIGRYRFYFYKNRLWDALAVARECLEKSLLDNGMSTNWRDAKPGDADFDNYAAVLPRFFLFTLKGYGYLNLRLGFQEEGKAAIDKLIELDPNDKLGGSVLLEVLKRQTEEDDD